MALSGQLRTSTTDGGSYFYVDWTATQSVSDNYSDVTWTLKMYCRYDYYSNAIRNYGLYVDGEKVYNGYVWSYINSGYYDLASGTKRIYHNQDGSKTFNINTSGAFYIDPGFGEVSGSQNFTLNAIPRKASLTNADNFNDEANPKITYTNNAGNSVTSLQARIESVNGQTVYAAYRDVPKTQGTYQFILTSAERSALRNATPNSNEMNVVFRLKTVIGSYSDTFPLTRKMNIINANPTFNNFTYEDTNAITTALTGNNQTVVIGYSNVKATISSSNKATANKGANMTSNGAKYQFVCGNATKDIAYSSSSDVYGTINNVSSGTFTVYAIDSRGNSKAVPKTASTIKNYSKITLNPNTATLERDQSGVGGNVTLHYEGTIWNENFGSVQNSVVSATYKFKKTTASTYTTGSTTITPTLSGNNLSFTGLIAGDGTGGVFDISSSYNVQITITDELSSYTINLILGSGTPNIAYADDGVAIMGDYDETIGNSLQVKGSLTASTLKENNYQITPININGSTSTLLSRVQYLAQNNIYEATWFVTTDGGSSGISDKPTGSTNGGFVCKAICNRHASSSDWRYILTAYVQNDYKNYYSAIVIPTTTNIVWVRPLQNENYSTSETIIGTWINNKPIYRIVAYISSLPNATTASYNIGLSNIDRIINVYGATNGGIGLNTPRPVTGNNYAIGCFYDIGENRLKIEVGTDRRSLNAYVIVEYTKTTD